LLLLHLLLLLLYLLLSLNHFIFRLFNHSYLFCNGTSLEYLHCSREVNHLVLKTSLNQHIKFLSLFFNSLGIIHYQTIITLCKFITINSHYSLGNIRSDIREFKASSPHCNFCSFKEALKYPLFKIFMGYKHPFCNMRGLKSGSFNTTNSFPIAYLTFSLF